MKKYQVEVLVTLDLTVNEALFLKHMPEEEEFEIYHATDDAQATVNMALQAIDIAKAHQYPGIQAELVDVCINSASEKVV